MRVSVPSLRLHKTIKRESSLTQRTSPNPRKSDYALQSQPISKTPPPKRVSAPNRPSTTRNLSNSIEANKSLESIRSFITNSCRLPPPKKSEFIDQISELKRILQKLVNSSGSRIQSKQPEAFWSTWNSFSSSIIKSMKQQQQNIPKQCRGSISSLTKKLEDPTKRYHMSFDDSGVFETISSTLDTYFCSDSPESEASPTNKFLKGLKIQSSPSNCSAAETLFNVEFNSMIAKLVQAVSDFCEQSIASKKLVELLNDSIPKLMAAAPTPIEVHPLKQIKSPSPQKDGKQSSQAPRVFEKSINSPVKSETSPEPVNRSPPPIKDSAIKEINNIRESNKIHKASIQKSNVLIKELNEKIQDLRDQEPILEKKAKEANLKKQVRDNALIEIESLKNGIEDLKQKKDDLKAQSTVVAADKRYQKQKETEMTEISKRNTELEAQISVMSEKLRNLKEESIMLQAKNQFLIEKLPKTISSPYIKYTNLKKTELSLIRDLFIRSQEVIRLSHMNRKCLYLSEKPESTGTQSDLLNIIKINDELNKSYQKELENRNKLEKEYESALFEKYLLEINNEFIQNETVSEEKLLELESSQDSLELAKTTFIEGEATELLKEINSIKNSTDRSILEVQTNLNDTIKKMKKSMNAKKNEYEELSEWYLENFTKDPNPKIFKNRELDPEESLRILEKISSDYSQIKSDIDRLCLDESKEEQKLIQDELDIFESRESSISNMIDTVYKDLIRTQAHTMTLDLQNYLLMQKLKQPDFDVDSALLESLEKSQKDASSLKTLVNGATDKLKDVDEKLGAPSGLKITLENRISNINRRLVR